MKEKIFSVEKANKTLTPLKKLLKRAKNTLDNLANFQTEIQQAVDQAKHNGGSPYGADYVRYVFQLDEITHAISKKGVHVKDLQRGVCDFPFELDGRIVYLCWQLGEDEIKWWHEISDGYAGRQRLDGKKRDKRVGKQ